MIKNGRDYEERVAELRAQRDKQIRDNWPKFTYRQLADHWSLSKSQIANIINGGEDGIEKHDDA